VHFYRKTFQKIRQLRWIFRWQYSILYRKVWQICSKKSSYFHQVFRLVFYCNFIGLFLILSSILVLVNIPYASILISIYIIASSFLLTYPTYSKGSNNNQLIIILGWPCGDFRWGRRFLTVGGSLYGTQHRSWMVDFFLLNRLLGPFR
jgi:hypothetical protein